MPKMTLRASATSPYVRKVRAVLIETGLDERVTRIPTDAWSADTDLPKDNPLGKVPALTTEDGLVLFDSPVICEYLDGLHDGAKLFPAPGPARWRALRQQAMADGICDAAIARRLDAQRPEAQQSAAWQERQRAAIARTCDLLEREAGELSGPVTIGSLAVAVALGYLDLRWPGDQWRQGRPALARWYEGMSARRSLAETVPPQ